MVYIKQFTKKAVLSLAALSLLIGSVPNYGSNLGKDLSTLKEHRGTIAVITMVTGLLAMYNMTQAVNHLALRQHDSDATENSSPTHSWQAKFTWNTIWAIVYGRIAHSGFVTLTFLNNL